MASTTYLVFPPQLAPAVGDEVHVRVEGEEEVVKKKATERTVVHEMSVTPSLVGWVKSLVRFHSVTVTVISGKTRRAIGKLTWVKNGVVFVVEKDITLDLWNEMLANALKETGTALLVRQAVFPGDSNPKNIVDWMKSHELAQVITGTLGHTLRDSCAKRRDWVELNLPLDEVVLDALKEHAMNDAEEFLREDQAVNRFLPNEVWPRLPTCVAFAIFSMLESKCPPWGQSRLGEAKAQVQQSIGRAPAPTKEQFLQAAKHASRDRTRLRDVKDVWVHAAALHLTSHMSDISIGDFSQAQVKAWCSGISTIKHWKLPIPAERLINPLFDTEQGVEELIEANFLSESVMVRICVKRLVLRDLQKSLSVISKRVSRFVTKNPESKIVDEVVEDLLQKLSSSPQSLFMAAFSKDSAEIFKRVDCQKILDRFESLPEDGFPWTTASKEREEAVMELGKRWLRDRTSLWDKAKDSPLWDSIAPTNEVGKSFLCFAEFLDSLDESEHRICTFDAVRRRMKKCAEGHPDYQSMERIVDPRTEKVPIRYLRFLCYLDDPKTQNVWREWRIIKFPKASGIGTPQSLVNDLDMYRPSYDNLEFCFTELGGLPVEEIRSRRDEDFFPSSRVHEGEVVFTALKAFSNRGCRSKLFLHQARLRVRELMSTEFEAQLRVLTDTFNKTRADLLSELKKGEMGCRIEQLYGSSESRIPNDKQESEQECLAQLCSPSKLYTDLIKKIVSNARLNWDTVESHFVNFANKLPCLELKISPKFSKWEDSFTAKRPFRSMCIADMESFRHGLGEFFGQDFGLDELQRLDSFVPNDSKNPPIVGLLRHLREVGDVEKLRKQLELLRGACIQETSSSFSKALNVFHDVYVPLFNMVCSNDPLRALGDFLILPIPKGIDFRILVSVLRASQQDGSLLNNVQAVRSAKLYLEWTKDEEPNISLRSKDWDFSSSARVPKKVLADEELDRFVAECEIRSNPHSESLFRLLSHNLSELKNIEAILIQAYQNGFIRDPSGSFSCSAIDANVQFREVFKTIRGTFTKWTKKCEFCRTIHPWLEGLRDVDNPRVHESSRWVRLLMESTRRAARTFLPNVEIPLRSEHDKDVWDLAKEWRDRLQRVSPPQIEAPDTFVQSLDLAQSVREADFVTFANNFLESPVGLVHFDDDSQAEAFAKKLKKSTSCDHDPRRVAFSLGVRNGMILGGLSNLSEITCRELLWLIQEYVFKHSCDGGCEHEKDDWFPRIILVVPTDMIASGLSFPPLWKLNDATSTMTWKPVMKVNVVLSSVEGRSKGQQEVDARCTVLLFTPRTRIQDMIELMGSRADLAFDLCTMDAKIPFNCVSLLYSLIRFGVIGQALPSPFVVDKVAGFVVLLPEEVSQEILTAPLNFLAQTPKQVGLHRHAPRKDISLALEEVHRLMNVEASGERVTDELVIGAFKKLPNRSSGTPERMPQPIPFVHSAQTLRIMKVMMERTFGASVPLSSLLSGDTGSGKSYLAQKYVELVIRAGVPCFRTQTIYSIAPSFNEGNLNAIADEVRKRYEKQQTGEPKYAFPVLDEFTATAIQGELDQLLLQRRYGPGKSFESHLIAPLATCNPDPKLDCVFELTSGCQYAKIDVPALSDDELGKFFELQLTKDPRGPRWTLEETKLNRIVRGFRSCVVECKNTEVDVGPITPRSVVLLASTLSWLQSKSWGNKSFVELISDDDVETEKVALVVAFYLFFGVRIVPRERFFIAMEQCVVAAREILDKVLSNVCKMYQLPSSIVETPALKDNIFCITLAVVTRKPLLILGDEAISSKTTSIEIVLSQMNGKYSNDEVKVLKLLPSVQGFRLQVSRDTTPQDIDRITKTVTEWGRDQDRSKGVGGEKMTATRPPTVSVPVVSIEELSMMDRSGPTSAMRAFHTLLDDHQGGSASRLVSEYGSGSNTFAFLATSNFDSNGSKTRTLPIAKPLANRFFILVHEKARKEDVVQMCLRYAGKGRAELTPNENERFHSVLTSLGKDGTFSTRARLFFSRMSLFLKKNHLQLDEAMAVSGDMLFGVSEVTRNRFRKCLGTLRDITVDHALSLDCAMKKDAPRRGMLFGYGTIADLEQILAKASDSYRNERPRSQHQHPDLSPVQYNLIAPVDDATGDVSESGKFRCLCKVRNAVESGTLLFVLNPESILDGLHALLNDMDEERSTIMINGCFESVSIHNDFRLVLLMSRVKIDALHPAVLSRLSIMRIDESMPEERITAIDLLEKSLEATLDEGLKEILPKLNIMQRDFAELAVDLLSPERKETIAFAVTDSLSSWTPPRKATTFNKSWSRMVFGAYVDSSVQSKPDAHVLLDLTGCRSIDVLAQKLRVWKLWGEVANNSSPVHGPCLLIVVPFSVARFCSSKRRWSVYECHHIVSPYPDWPTLKEFIQSSIVADLRVRQFVESQYDQWERVFFDRRLQAPKQAVLDLVFTCLTNDMPVLNSQLAEKERCRAILGFARSTLRRNEVTSFRVAIVEWCRHAALLTLREVLQRIDVLSVAEDGMCSFALAALSARLFPWQETLANCIQSNDRTTEVISIGTLFKKPCGPKGLFPFLNDFIHWVRQSAGPSQLEEFTRLLSPSQLERLVYAFTAECAGQYREQTTRKVQHDLRPRDLNLFEAISVLEKAQEWIRLACCLPLVDHFPFDNDEHDLVSHFQHAAVVFVNSDQLLSSIDFDVAWKASQKVRTSSSDDAFHRFLILWDAFKMTGSSAQDSFHQTRSLLVRDTAVVPMGCPKNDVLTRLLLVVDELDSEAKAIENDLSFAMMFSGLLGNGEMLRVVGNALTRALSRRFRENSFNFIKRLAETVDCFSPAGKCLRDSITASISDMADSGWSMFKTLIEEETSWSSKKNLQWYVGYAFIPVFARLQANPIMGRGGEHREIKDEHIRRLFEGEEALRSFLVRCLLHDDHGGVAEKEFHRLVYLGESVGPWFQDLCRASGRIPDEHAWVCALLEAEDQDWFAKAKQMCPSAEFHWRANPSLSFCQVPLALFCLLLSSPRCRQSPMRGMFSEENAARLFVPAMERSPVELLRSLQGITTLNRCIGCGFVFGIGNCGGAVMERPCPGCGRPVGGTGHRLNGNTVGVTDDEPIRGIPLDWFVTDLSWKERELRPEEYRLMCVLLLFPLAYESRDDRRRVQLGKHWRALKSVLMLESDVALQQVLTGFLLNSWRTQTFEQLVMNSAPFPSSSGSAMAGRTACERIFHQASSTFTLDSCQRLLEEVQTRLNDDNGGPLRQYRSNVIQKSPELLAKTRPEFFVIGATANTIRWMDELKSELRDQLRSIPSDDPEDFPALSRVLLSSDDDARTPQGVRRKLRMSRLLEDEMEAFVQGLKAVNKYAHVIDVDRDGGTALDVVSRAITNDSERDAFLRAWEQLRYGAEIGCQRVEDLGSLAALTPRDMLVRSKPELDHSPVEAALQQLIYAHKDEMRMFDGIALESMSAFDDRVESALLPWKSVRAIFDEWIRAQPKAPELQHAEHFLQNALDFKNRELRMIEWPTCKVAIPPSQSSFVSIRMKVEPKRLPHPFRAAWSKLSHDQLIELLEWSQRECAVLRESPSRVSHLEPLNLPSALRSAGGPVQVQVSYLEATQLFAIARLDRRLESSLDDSFGSLIPIEHSNWMNRVPRSLFPGDALLKLLVDLVAESQLIGTKCSNGYLVDFLDSAVFEPKEWGDREAQAVRDILNGLPLCCLRTIITQLRGSL